MAAAAMRYRVKGTQLYVEPRSIRAEIPSAYTTVGSGPRSLRWRPPLFGPNSALDYSQSVLRNQSRELIRKNSIAAAALERIIANVIGTGIKPQHTDAGLMDLWTAWTDESSADGTLDFYGQQAQVMASVFVAGECFIRKRNRLPQDGLTVPLQIEVFEPELVPLDWNYPASPGTPDIPARGEIRQGVEFDPNLKAKRVAYWVYPRHPGENINAAGDMTPVRVPASEIDHIYSPSRPGQIRGEPWMARILDVLADVEQYDKAELVRKKIATMFVGFVSGSLPEGLSLSDLQGIYGTGEAADPTAITSEGVGDVAMEPGSILYGRPGEKMEFGQPSDVGGQYEVFLRVQMRKIASALGLLYEQISGDYSTVNDRTWRAAVSEFRRRCEQWQHALIVFQFCRPIWQRWVQMGQLAKVISPSVSVKAPIVWCPPRWPYINPLQDVQALEAEMRSGITSRSRVVSDRGDDAAMIDKEQASDNDRADALGLAYDSDGRRAIKGAVAQEAPTKAGEIGGPQPADQPADATTPPTAMLGHNGGPQLDLFAEAVAKVVAAARPEQQSQPGFGLVLDEKRINIDMVRAEDVTVETWDEQNRIKTLIARPISGKGKAKRRTAKHDPVTGRAIGWTEEVLDEENANG